LDHFSAYRDEDGTTVAQAHLLIRANDPIYELMMSLGLNRAENIQWQGTLRNLAAHFGASGKVETRGVCVDPKRQWRHYKNIRHNVLIRSALHALTAPLRWLRPGPQAETQRVTKGEVHDGSNPAAEREGREATPRRRLLGTEGGEA
jgi:hypothetical protein